MKESKLYLEVKAELEDIAKSAEEYSTSEDSPLAEFLSDMFYSEVSASQLDYSRLSDDAADALKKLIKRNPKSWREKVRALCDLEHIPDVWCRDGEILNAIIGEQEHQIDSSMDIVEKIHALTAEEFEKIKREFLGSRSKQTDRDFWFYTCHDYERWALILDETKLLKMTSKAGA